MTRLSRYEDAFWESDICGTAGFDALVKRCKEGQQVLQDVEEFVLGRAKAEEEYGKSLMKLVKNFTSRNEIGTLRAAWDSLRQQTEATGKLHIDMNTALCDLAQRLHIVTVQSTEQRKKTADTVKKLQASKADLYKKALNYHKAYKLKYEQHSGADLLYQTEKGKGPYGKELDKLESKMIKAKEELNKADAQYKSGIDALDEARIEWEKEMAKACQVFQKADEERIEILRNEMWVLLNIDSQACCEQDANNDKARAVLEHCSIENDINIFIEKNRTGKDRPSPVVYESCDGQQQLPAPSAAAAAACVTSPSGMQPGLFPLSPPSLPPQRPPRPVNAGGGGIYEDIDSARGGIYSIVGEPRR